MSRVFLKIIFRGCPIIHSLSNGALLERLVNATIGPFIRGKIRRVLHRTRLKDANFPYKRHTSSKIRRGLAKTRLILEQPLTPVLR